MGVEALVVKVSINSPSGEGGEEVMRNPNYVVVFSFPLILLQAKAVSV